MQSREYLSALIEEHVARLPYPAEPAKLYQPMAYGMNGGGKRLRPLLTLMCCDLFGGNCEQALNTAVGIEMFHNFTLLHDDIMDNSAVRRGRPSVFKKWGANTAILSGDAMMLYAYSLIVKCDDKYLRPVVESFNRMALEVCEGQQYDIDFESQPSVAMESYMEMIRLKTSVLLACAAQVGAILGGASEEDAKAIYRFAEQLGLAFQIQDDILDVYGTQEQLGKPIGGDILEGKKTFMMITAMDHADAKTRAQIRELVENDMMSDKEKINSVRYLYDSLNVKDIAQQAVAEHLSSAVAALDELSIAAERTAGLRELTDGLRNRNK